MKWKRRRQGRLRGLREPHPSLSQPSLIKTDMSGKVSFLRASVSILARNTDYAWLSRVSPASVESLHQLCDEVHRSLLGGPLFGYRKSDWSRAIENEGIDPKYVEYANRSERAGMLTVLTADGTLRHCDVLLGVAHSAVHNRAKGSFVARVFHPSAGLDENCKRVGFAFLELVDARSQSSQSLPWDPNFPLGILKEL